MTKKTYDTVEVEIADGIAWVTLNRPEKRNAMNPQLHFDMVEALTWLNTEPESQVLVLTGAGNSWCAGQDLKEFFREMDDKPVERALARDADRRWGWYKLRGFSKPTIAMVNGYCFGGAFIPLIACDFAIAADDATFGLSEINWGIIPGGLVSKVVADTLTPRKAIYYACTGRTLNGKEAEEVGLVTYSVPAEKLREEVETLARELMDKPTAVLRSTKEAIYAVRNMSIDEAYEYLEAKSEQLRFRDAEATRARGIREFIDEKKYRPGFQPVGRPQ